MTGISDRSAVCMSTVHQDGQMTAELNVRCKTAAVENVIRKLP